MQRALITGISAQERGYLAERSGWARAHGYRGCNHDG